MKLKSKIKRTRPTKRRGSNQVKNVPRPLSAIGSPVAYAGSTVKGHDIEELSDWSTDEDFQIEQQLSHIEQSMADKASYIS